MDSNNTPTGSARRVAATVRLLAAALLVGLTGSLVPPAASAQGRNGFYLRGDFGDADALTIRGEFDGVDQPTRCDRLLYPDPATVPRDVVSPAPASAVFATSEFDQGAETMTSATALAFGYARGPLRLEVEASTAFLGSTSAPLSDAGNLAGERFLEWSTAEPPRATISGLSVSDVFVNLQLDIPTSTRFTPFLGVGGGVSQVIFVLDGLRVRRTLAEGFWPVGGVDPGAGAQIPAWQARAAGTADSASLQVAARTLGANVIGGVAIEANERFTIALRGRYSRYRDIRLSGEWDVIRSHRPVLADGQTPATFHVVLRDLVSYSVSLSFTYRL